MALEHALLVSLLERPAAGLELASRFDRSIGFFWPASHQQIYKTLRRMESNGWVTSEEVGQVGRREKIVYTATPDGQQALDAWIAQPTPRLALRSDLALKMRGASFGDRRALRTHIRELLEEHKSRLAFHQFLRSRDYAEPSELSGQELDHYLVLRGGLLIEELWVSWLTEYLERTDPALEAPAVADSRPR